MKSSVGIACAICLSACSGSAVPKDKEPLAVRGLGSGSSAAGLTDGEPNRLPPSVVAAIVGANDFLTQLGRGTLTYKQSGDIAIDRAAAVDRAAVTIPDKGESSEATTAYFRLLSAVLKNVAIHSRSWVSANVALDFANAYSPASGAEERDRRVSDLRRARSEVALSKESAANSIQELGDLIANRGFMLPQEARDTAKALWPVRELLATSPPIAASVLEQGLTSDSYDFGGEISPSPPSPAGRPASNGMSAGELDDALGRHK